MTTIRITDRATNPEEVVKYLRKTADLVEALADGATVVVGGDLNIEVRYEPESPPKDWDPELPRQKVPA